MKRDLELSRLKAEQDLALQLKQSASKVKRQAWVRLSELNDELDEYLSGLKKELTRMKRDKKRSFRNMAFEYNNTDKDLMRICTNEAEYSENEISPLTKCRKPAKNNKSVKPIAKIMHDKFEQMKRLRDSARTDHKNKSIIAQQAESEYKKATKALNRELAKLAGIDNKYLDSVKVDYKKGGVTHFFFGGSGCPNGVGHGHYVTDKLNNVIYRREPCRPHGGHNYVHRSKKKKPPKASQANELSVHNNKKTIRVSGVDDRGKRVTLDVYFDKNKFVSLSRACNYKLYPQIIDFDS